MSIRNFHAEGHHKPEISKEKPPVGKSHDTRGGAGRTIT